MTLEKGRNRATRCVAARGRSCASGANSIASEANKVLHRKLYMDLVRSIKCCRAYGKGVAIRN